MEQTKSTHGEIAQEFLRGRGCSQCVLGRYAKALGYDEDETDRMAACFVGGMLMGDVCGAVTGGLMAIGLAYPAGESKEKAAEFEKRFAARCGSCVCRELLGLDLSDPEQALTAKQSGKLLEYCPTPVLEAMDILDEMLGDVL